MPPGTGKFEAFLDDEAMSAFDLVRSDRKIGSERLAVLELARMLAAA
jgi:hypothetical protein